MEMRPTARGKRQQEPSGDDDMVCGLELCHDCDGDFKDEMT